MVDLPSVPTRIVTSQAPTSSVGPGQIEAPYQMLANNLNKIGEVGNEVAGKLAEDAGRAAVSADGKTIEQPSIPIIGPASAEFARAARFTALARQTPDIENKMAEMRLAHPNDPQGFKTAADAYTKQLVDNTNDPALKGPIERTALGQASAGYRSVLEQTTNTNIQNVKTSVTSQISDLTNKMASTAFTGGVDTPEYKQWQSDLGALYGELGKDARLGYPKERIESEISTLISQNKTMAIAGQAVRMMDGTDINGRANAKKWLVDKVYNDPTLNLSLAQRHQAVTTAMGLMEARSSENKALIDANKATVTTFLSELKSSKPYNDIAFNDLRANSIRIGDTEGVMKLDAEKAMHDWNQSVRSLPMPQQVAALKELDRARVPFENRLVGSESSGNPRLVNQLGYAGLYQFGAPRLADVGVYTPGAGEDLKGWSKSGADAPGKWSGTFAIPGFPQVKTVQDFLQSPDAQRAAYGAHQGKMDQEIKALGLDKFEGQTVGGVTINRTALYGMMHLGGAQGTLNALSSGGANAARDANGTSVMDYAKKFGQPNNPGEAWFNQARIEQVSRSRDYVKTQLPEYIDTFMREGTKTGILPTDQLKAINDAIVETGSDNLRPKLNEFLIKHYAVADLEKLPQADRLAWLSRTTKEAAESQTAFRVHEQMGEGINATIKAMQDTPYSTYAVRTHGAPPPAYNFADPQAVAVVASNRAAMQKSIRANDGTGPVSVFEGKEADAFANTLTNGDPAAAGAALNGLATLPDDVYEATLAQKPVAEAVRGMMFSQDPARIDASMKAVDLAWKRDPKATEDAFKKDAIDRLQVWQGLRSSFPADKIAEKFMQIDDPARAAGRKAVEALAATELEKVTPQDVASKFVQGWPLLRQITGGVANAPESPVTSQELAADYKTIYTTLRSNGAAPDKAAEGALERLKQSWGPSQSNGYQVMKFPPERYYPSVGGSHDWIQEEIHKEVEAHLGPQESKFNRPGRDGEPVKGADFLRSSATPNWKVVGIAPYKDADARLNAGQRPAYSIIVQKADGMIDTMVNKSTGQSAVVFDPQPHLDKQEAASRRHLSSNELLRGLDQPPVGSMGALMGVQ